MRHRSARAVRSRIALATVLVACGIAATVSTAPAQAAEGGWRMSYINPEVPGQDTWLERVAAVDARNVWATGAVSSAGEGTGFLRHWNGSTWNDVELPVELGWAGPVAASSTRNVWAFGPAKWPATGYHALRWNGYSWTTHALGDFRASDAVVRGKNDVWVVGSDEQGTARAMHWNGERWRKTTMPDHPIGITAAPGAGVWAVGVREYEDQERLGLVSIMRLRGGEWRRVPIPKVTLPPGEDSGLAELRDITVLSPDDIWAVGTIVWNPPEGDGPMRTLLLHWNGERWRVEIGDGDPEESYVAVAPDGAGGVWAATSDRSYYHHAADGRVTRVEAPFPAERRFGPMMSDLVNVPGTTSMIAVGRIQPAPGTPDETWDAVVQTYE